MIIGTHPTIWTIRVKRCRPVTRYTMCSRKFLFQVTGGAIYVKERCYSIFCLRTFSLIFRHSVFVRIFTRKTTKIARRADNNNTNFHLHTHQNYLPKTEGSWGAKEGEGVWWQGSMEGLLTSYNCPHPRDRLPSQGANITSGSIKHRHWRQLCTNLKTGTKYSVTSVALVRQPLLLGQFVVPETSHPLQSTQTRFVSLIRHDIGLTRPFFGLRSGQKNSRRRNSRIKIINEKNQSLKPNNKFSSIMRPKKCQNLLAVFKIL